MRVTSIRLQPDLEVPLDQVVHQLHRSKNWVINEAVREYLHRRQNESQRWAETLSALESVAAGRVMESASVHQWLAGWGKENEASMPGSS